MIGLNVVTRGHPSWSSACRGPPLWNTPRMIRRRFLVTGIVQGVGFRPFVWRQAIRLELSGFVENTPGGVVIELQGAAAAVESFTNGLVAAAPPLAVIDRVAAEDLPPQSAEPPGRFCIRASEAGDAPRTDVPADVATCLACLMELNDPTNRRHGHAFISCTDCGPRFTIIEHLPYDRATTTMRGFPLCSQCIQEYEDPADRRFHAQPIACLECGPVVWLATAAGDTGGVPAERPATLPSSAQAMAAARKLLAAGGILAAKNLGGFQLVCDATNPAAVARLRDRKRRPGKPLAVMVADLLAARQIAIIDDQEARLLDGPERPILLVRKRPGSGLAAAIAPDNDFVGVMLPAAPLQHLLAHGMPPLVMTSGNLAEESIAIDNSEAAKRLGRIADGFLLHDRGIRVACDDSVVRCVAGAPLPIRRARGYTPLPVRLATGGPAVLAVGGELKAALCLAVGNRAIMGQHLGDVGTLETLRSLERSAEQLLTLFRVEPTAIVADLHPGYLSAEWAAGFAKARGIPLQRVQHHEAHTAALLTEHFGQAIPPGNMPCLVACFDGTGYAPANAPGGTGSTIRGGEFFRVDAAGIHHAACLAHFPLPGGDAAIRHPWRTALALLHAAGIPWNERLPAVRAAGVGERSLLRQQLDHHLACTPTTSMGRLFDGVAAIAGGPPSVTFEAEAALTLESWAIRRPHEDNSRYSFDLASAAGAGPLTIDWRGLVAAVVCDVLAGEPVEEIAAGFHHAVVRMISAVCNRLAANGPAMMGLTGGVFQNATLVELASKRLGAAGCDLLLHHSVPPNDGGLALGQAVLARQRLTDGGE